MRTVSVKLPEQLDAKLTALSRQRGMSRSALVREALETLFARTRAPRKVSAFALAKDLAGCVAGPGDLSFNKDYLKDYGR